MTEGQVLAALESSVERATLLAARAWMTMQAPLRTGQARVDIASTKEMDAGSSPRAPPTRGHRRGSDRPDPRDEARGQ